jgi:hypothetical protein
MSVRNLDKLLKPQSIALIGATPRPGAVGALVARNLRRAGFAGELMFVNPHRQRRQRRAKPGNIAPRRGSVSVGRYSSTAVLPDAVGGIGGTRRKMRSG